MPSVVPLAMPIGTSLTSTGRVSRFSQSTSNADHGLIVVMKEAAISEFKAKCLSLLEEVEKTKKRSWSQNSGKPIAEVNPPSPNQKSRSWLGSMKGELVAGIR